MNADAPETPETVDTPDTTAPQSETATESREAFFARVRSGIKTTRVRFYLGAEAEWADLIGLGISAEQMAAVNAADDDADDSGEQMERGLREMCRVISDSVYAWSLPLPPTYDELVTWPQNLLSEVWERLTTAGQALPKDRLPKKATKKTAKRSR